MDTTTNGAEIKCEQCGSPLQISNSPNNLGGITKCRRCYRRRYYNEHKAAVQASHSESYKRHATARRARAKKLWHALPKSERYRRARMYVLKNKYGITKEQYDRMLNEQGGICFLCSCLPKEHQILSVDHQHESGHVRKLLCENCNRALGYMERDMEWTLKAIAYLNSYPPAKPEQT